MTDVVLHMNATPVYRFLSLINTLQTQGEAPAGRKILDCGAGGPIPPLALFHQQGYDCWGIDLSDEQLLLAHDLCREQGTDLNLREADMRCLPFDDESFDYVYEHYSMCHLSKEDTARSIGEMYRVLRKGGLCFLGLISMDSWPLSAYGEEREPGEFWMFEHGDELTRHSLFSDEQAAQLVAGWEIRLHEKHVRYLRGMAEERTLEEWMDLHAEAPSTYTRDDWQARYDRRAAAFQYVHTYYMLRKLV